MVVLVTQHGFCPGKNYFYFFFFILKIVFIHLACPFTMVLRWRSGDNIRESVLPSHPDIQFRLGHLSASATTTEPACTIYIYLTVKCNYGLYETQISSQYMWPSSPGSPGKEDFKKFRQNKGKFRWHGIQSVLSQKVKVTKPSVTSPPGWISKAHRIHCILWTLHHWTGHFPWSWHLGVFLARHTLPASCGLFGIY